MPKWLRRLALPVVALGLVAAACSNNDSSSTASGASGSATEECTSDITVGVALDVGGLGDNGFNDLSQIGLQKAIDEGIICESNTKFLESNADGTNLDENTQSLAADGYNLVIGTGFAFTPGINAIAPDYPDTDFGIIDGYATCGTACGLDNDAKDIPNVTDLAFQEEQGSYLVGVAAGLKAQELNCDNVGFLGGADRPADRQVPGWVRGRRGRGGARGDRARRVHRRHHQGVRRRNGRRGPVEEDVRRRRLHHLPRRR